MKEGKDGMIRLRPVVLKRVEKSKMKAAAVLVLLLASACASTRNSVQLEKPLIRLYQLGGSSMALQYQGRLSLGYAVQVTNQSGEPITLRQVTLRTIGGGPYVISSSPIFVNRTFEPGQSGVVEFSANAFSYGGRTAAIEPVTISGIARFETPVGPFQTPFTQMLEQPRGGF